MGKIMCHVIILIAVALTEKAVSLSSDETANKQKAVTEQPQFLDDNTIDEQKSTTTEPSFKYDKANKEENTEAPQPLFIADNVNDEQKSTTAQPSSQSDKVNKEENTEAPQPLFIGDETANEQKVVTEQPQSLATLSQRSHDTTDKQTTIAADTSSPTSGVSTDKSTTSAAATTSSSSHVTTGKHTTLAEPINPQCPNANFDLVKEDYNSTSITLRIGELGQTKLCVKIKKNSQPLSQGECKSIESTSVTFGDLTAGKDYSFEFFSYLPYSNGTKVLSSSCHEYSTYTGPTCPAENNILVKDFNSTSITLQFKDPPMDKLCVKTKKDRLVSEECNALKNTSVTIGNLTAGTEYSFEIFSYLIDSNKLKVLSSKACTVYSAYTRPDLPTCPVKNDILVKDFNSTSITLQFKDPPMDKLCVKTKKDRQVSEECNALKNTSVTIGNLTAGTEYSFEIFSYLMDSNELKVLSSNFCTAYSTYTRPTNPNCTKIDGYSNSTNITVTVQLGESRQTNLCAKIKEDLKEFFSKNCEPFQNNLVTFRNLTEGTRYFFKMFSYVNDQNGHQVLSNGSCAEFSKHTTIPKPYCSNSSLKAINSTTVQLDLSQCNISSRATLVQLSYNLPNGGSDYKDTSELKSKVLFLKRSPGSEVVITIFARDDDQKSAGFVIKKFTKPNDPDCSSITQTAHNDSVEIKITNYRTKRITYNLEVPKPALVNSLSTRGHFVVENLEPGRIYNASQYAIGPDNQLSLNNCTFELVTKPNDPTCEDAQVFNVQTNSVELNLSLLHTDGAIYYKAEYNVSGNHRTVKFEKISFFKVKLSPLSSGTQYLIRIFAVGINDEISQGSCDLLTYTLPSCPKNLTSIIPGVSFFQIQWSHTEGHVDYYNVSANCSIETDCETCLQKANTQRSITEKQYTCEPQIHQWQEDSANITGLLPGTYCDVTIIAISGEFQSEPFHYSNIKTTEEVSGIVTNFVVMNKSSNAISMKWSKPKCPNGDLLNYTIYVSPQTTSNISMVELPAAKTSYRIQHLKPGTCYNITVAAINEAGRGQSSLKRIYTSETGPGEVKDLTVKNMSSTSVSVRWHKPTEPNGIIMKYEIILQKVIGKYCVRRIFLQCLDCREPCSDATQTQGDKIVMEEDSKIQTQCNHPEIANFSASDNELHHEMTGLEIFTDYSITVRAHTANSPGVNSSREIKTSADKPSPPRNLTVSDQQSENFSFVYSKPEYENGIITHQEIEYSYFAHNVCTTAKEKSVTVTKKVEQEIREENGKFAAYIGGLHPFWEYSIKVRVRTYAGYSNFSKLLQVRTSPAVPGKVSEVTAENKTSRNISLSWKPPCYPNGIIVNYNITIITLNDSSIRIINTKNNNTFFVVDRLFPYRIYQFNVSAQVESVNTLGPAFQSDNITTEIEEPFPPRNISILQTTASSVKLHWAPPSLKTGPTSYIVYAIDKENATLDYHCNTRGFENTSCEINGLDAYWTYTLNVSVLTGDFPAKSIRGDIKTKESAPGKVAVFSVEQDENVTVPTNVHVAWEPPVKRDLNGIIQAYFIRYWTSSADEQIKAYGANDRSVDIYVTAQKTYSFEIFAMTIQNATEKRYVREVKIKPGAPLPLPPQKTPIIQEGSGVSDDQKQVSVDFNQAAVCNENNGKIVQRFVIVSKGSIGSAEKHKFHGEMKQYLQIIKNKYKTWKDVYEKDNNFAYIASNSWNPICNTGKQKQGNTEVIFSKTGQQKQRNTEHVIKFIVGDEKECSGGKEYCNGFLEPDTTYWLRFTVCTEGGCLESAYSNPITTAPNNVPVIAGAVTGVVLAILVLTIVFVYLKRNKKGPFKDVDSVESGHQNEGFSSAMEMKSATVPKAVKIADFANYVQKMHADSNLLFSSEYKLLKETCPVHSTIAAETQVNRIKNRYTNILSYDHSRVKLLPTEDDEGSDYINANYIPGFNSPREYIATQGPLPFTRDEFWRMIWEQNVSIIVMLTQLVERGRRKCDIYWPETTREPVYYGDLVVEIESESTLPDYVLRVMSLKLGDSRKTVKHFSYLAWPDMGIPETSETMLKFTKEVRSHLSPPTTNRGPIVVHCSAGVGRTGTFIAVDYLMQHVSSSDVIDIYSYVMKMRNNRPNMVQTEDQYIFIHDCIKDYVNRSDEDSDDENEQGEEDQENPIYANT